ncbi:hypothetical protein P2H44_06300 [Albimonas sp. CAU 1670]|uniref:hypothetical protein n=1 Tax=Albimonas sp. CAU 1670 TaxID=3032599 RepID=UPI0023DA7D13|nr:hypothetical protein [Albimonas sp. CAU 1670]MDF2232160.1 hypothetical protein [Albimonas sp. CAU 1670]
MISVSPLVGATDFDGAEIDLGTLAPTGGVPPYEIVAIWPAGPVSGFDPDRIVLGVRRDRAARSAAPWRVRASRPAAAWRMRQTRPEATWT